MNIEFREHCSVRLVRAQGTDQDIAEDARVSTTTDRKIVGGITVRDASDVTKDAGLVRALMRERHGTPFEAPNFTFEIEAPIFVARESHRHRMISVSEISGRYAELAPVFWVPSADRPLVQVGKAMAYQLEPGTPQQLEGVHWHLRVGAEEAWTSYQAMLQAGVAKEVARVVLPVNIFTKWRARGNLRAWLNYISLRTRDERATYESKPMLEIQEVAVAIERSIKINCPAAMAAFNEFGRVAP